MAELFLVEAAKPAPAPSAALPDAFERKQALDIRRSWIVEAPAGSGKTGLLIQRYLKLLADESVAAPEQVLAITFTHKAAAEMRHRVLSQLQLAHDDIAPGNAFDRETRPLALAVLVRDSSLDWHLLDRSAGLNLRTIDSVCQEIANSLPVLSGSGGRRSPVEDASPHYTAAARRTWMELGGSDTQLDSALRTVLLHRDGNLANCEDLLADMLHFREQWGDLIPLGRQELDDFFLDTEVLPRLETALNQAICSALTQLAQTIPDNILNQLTSAAAEMAHIAGYKGAVSPIAICAGKHASPKAAAEDLAHWQALIHLLVTKENTWRKRHNSNDVKFELGKSEGEKLKALVQQFENRDDLLRAIRGLGTLPPAKYPSDQWDVAKALFRILNRALAELQIVFAERAQCDFAELALAARAVLRNEDGARDLEAANAVHYQHLLVDEMQDTSSSQYELIQTLTQRWDGHSQTVFLVGDPKQSIYLFRLARVERFLRTMHSEQLGDLPLGRLQLTANFRSQGALVSGFNDHFERIFPAEMSAQHPEEVHFVRAFPMRPPERNADNRVWHTNVLPYSDEPVQRAGAKRRQRLEDGRKIRGIVEAWQATPIPAGRIGPWKIAVLVRSRNHLDEIVAAFKDESSGPPIPFRAVDIETLNERPEVQDVYALTRALLHPADRTAWLAVLRAPWCGFALAELLLLTGADDPAFSQRSMQSLIADRGDLLSSEAIERLERVWPILEAAVALTGRALIAQLVERTWRSLGGDAYASATELANVDAYLHLIDDLDSRPEPFTLAALDRRLKKLYAAPDLHPGAVDLLTIHKAKGLEWDVVIVPALERRAGKERSRLLNWLELDSPDRHAAHVLLAPIAGKGEPSEDLNKWIKSVRTARETAELKRLFYVACTRAREELHLFAAPALSAKGEIKPAPGSLLNTAWPAAEDRFAAPLSESQFKRSLEVVCEGERDGSGPSSVPEDTALDIAASNAPDERPAILKRLPLAFDPAARFTAAKPLYRAAPAAAASRPQFDRPEGTIAARAIGNAVHVFLEKIAQQLAAGDSVARKLSELPAWAPRVTAVLRSEGLPPLMIERLTQRVLHALEATLKDPIGLWLLLPHQGAATEYSFTDWSTERSNIRIDRVFRAGPEPLAPGTSHLWIVDYKTTTHGLEGLDAFLAEERKTYARQLETYAAVLRQTEGEPSINLALYYPMLPKLIWWVPG